MKSKYHILTILMNKFYKANGETAEKLLWCVYCNTDPLFNPQQGVLFLFFKLDTDCAIKEYSWVLGIWCTDSLSDSITSSLLDLRAGFPQPVLPGLGEAGAGLSPGSAGPAGGAGHQGSAGSSRAAEQCHRSFPSKYTFKTIREKEYLFQKNL